MAVNIELSSPTTIAFPDEQLQALIAARKFVDEHFEAAKAVNYGGMGGHFFDHFQRVAGMSGQIAIAEKVDPFLPVLTAHLIDVGRTTDTDEARSFRHGSVSRKLAEPLLESLDVLSGADRSIVANAIEDHSRQNHQVRESEVVKIVMDSDRLGSLGALAPVRAGATRWYLPLYSMEVETSTVDNEIKTIYQDFSGRVLEWGDMLWTKTAQEIAPPRILALKAFIEEFRREASFMHRAYEALGIAA